MDNKTKVYLSVATSYIISTYENMSEEDIAGKADEVVTDAMKDVPETDDGKAVKEKAENIIAVHETNSSENSYAPNVFDYTELRDKSAIPACVQILKAFGEQADSLFITKNDTEERSNQIDTAYNFLADTVIKIFNENNVAIKDFKYAFNNLKALFESFGSAIDAKVDNQKSEVMARYIGAKNPGTDKFDQNYATYASLVEARDKVFQETGAKLEDYHHMVPQE